MARRRANMLQCGPPRPTSANLRRTRKKARSEERTQANSQIQSGNVLAINDHGASSYTIDYAHTCASKRAGVLYLHAHMYKVHKESLRCTPHYYCASRKRKN